MSIQKREEKIPKGLYCYDERGICPYWRRIDGREEQEDGWCDYLGKGDYEINREDNVTLIVVTHSIEIAHLMNKVYILEDGILKESS